MAVDGDINSVADFVKYTATQKGIIAKAGIGEILSENAANMKFIIPVGLLIVVVILVVLLFFVIIPKIKKGRR